MSFIGKNLEEHFQAITLEQASPYIKLADKLYNATLPPTPTAWKYDTGWHKYCKDGTATRVPFPDASACVFDVETLVNGNYPVMATAVSESAWFVYFSIKFM